MYNQLNLEEKRPTALIIISALLILAVVALGGKAMADEHGRGGDGDHGRDRGEHRDEHWDNHGYDRDHRHGPWRGYYEGPAYGYPPPPVYYPAPSPPVIDFVIPLHFR